jgi:Fe-S-cluster-containing dehydrogenase component/DMSO reductase anchor subunit
MIAPTLQDETQAAAFIDVLLAEQHNLTAVERFAHWHEKPENQIVVPAYRRLLPSAAPLPGEQYAFEVHLDQCSGCKACVTACHSLNGLDETETWRSVGLLISAPSTTCGEPFQQHVTTTCHHCVDPACLNGCPVLAYDKDPITGIVRHLDDQCIGCQYCVMKCPYEVPKFSTRLGIVRKCDMCLPRLADGEAPACVQACPNEAIRITLIDHESALAYRQPNARAFLPDSPDPRITLPTTRLISERGLPDNVLAADHNSLRLAPPHRPLVIMLVLSQAAAGLFLAASVLGFNITPAEQRILAAAGIALLLTGLTAAVFHLGRPFKAWRAFLGWRKSWLSRELIVLNLFALVAAVVFMVPQLVPLAAGFGLAGVFASAMVYVDTARPLWSPRIAFGNFFGTTLLLGATLAAVMFGWTEKFAVAQPCAIAALVIRTMLFMWRRLELRVALRHRSSAIHFNARVIRELLAWTTSTRTTLFVLSTAFDLLGIGNFLAAAKWWAGLAALATLSSEIIGRYVFFAASASKRMPGGVPA